MSIIEGVKSMREGVKNLNYHISSNSVRSRGPWLIQKCIHKFGGGYLRTDIFLDIRSLVGHLAGYPVNFISGPSLLIRTQVRNVRSKLEVSNTGGS